MTIRRIASLACLLCFAWSHTARAQSSFPIQAISPVNPPPVAISADTRLMQKGAIVSRVHVLRIGPTLDSAISYEDWHVHPSSCITHVQLRSAKFTKRKINSLLNELGQLEAPLGSSYVAIYIRKPIFNDKEFVKSLQERLPRCKIYPLDYNQFFGRSLWPAEPKSYSHPEDSGSKAMSNQ